MGQFQVVMLLILAWTVWTLYARARNQQSPPERAIQERKFLHPITTAIANFDRTWDRSFKDGYETRESARELYDLAACTQNAFSNALFSLPNDLDREQTLTDWARRVRKDQRAKIEDLKLRCGAPLLFPGPLDQDDDEFIWSEGKR